jgi:hypothetical protein
MLTGDNRPMSIIQPAKSHPEVVIAAVAARDEGRAKVYAKKYGIKKVHGGYQGMFTLCQSLADTLKSLVDWMESSSKLQVTSSIRSYG